MSQHTPDGWIEATDADRNPQDYEWPDPFTMRCSSCDEWSNPDECDERERCPNCQPVALLMDRAPSGGNTATTLTKPANETGDTNLSGGESEPPKSEAFNKDRPAQSFPEPIEGPGLIWAIKQIRKRQGIETK